MTKKILNFHFRRLEFKYLIPIKIADALIPNILKYMEIDNYTGHDDHYMVNSLYFDSNDLICYQQKLDGILFRKKYRIRYYSHGRQYFFEVKRKMGDTVIKDRALLENQIDLTEYNMPNITDISKLKLSNQKLRGEILSDHYSFNLKPKLLIQYKRKPFNSKLNNNLRLTIDYDICATRQDNSFFSPHSTRHFLSRDLAVLEIKFNESVPSWLGYIIKTHNLNRTAFSKYAYSVESAYNFK